MLQNRYRKMLENFFQGKTTVKGYLDELNNLCGGLYVQIHEYEGYCTKWKDWFEIRDNDWWVKKINHRSILWPEIVFDVDLPGYLNKQERELILAMILKRLKELTIHPVIIETGKGYHLHYFCQEMVMNLSQLRKIRAVRERLFNVIISDIRTDMAKVSEKTLIALETSKHWKRGNQLKLWSEEETMGLLTAYEKIIGKPMIKEREPASTLSFKTKKGGDKCQEKG